jgi:hypothetical protein
MDPLATAFLSSQELGLYTVHFSTRIAVLVLFFIIETIYVVEAGLKFELLCLWSAGIREIGHHAWVNFLSFPLPLSCSLLILKPTLLTLC